MSQYEITLTPTRCDQFSRFKPFRIDAPVWQRAVSLVEATGYRGNTFNGLDRVTTTHFVGGLRQALEQGRAKHEDQSVLTSLVAYLEGAGAGGTRLSRNYKRCV